MNSACSGDGNFPRNMSALRSGHDVGGARFRREPSRSGLSSAPSPRRTVAAHPAAREDRPQSANYKAPSLMRSIQVLFSKGLLSTEPAQCPLRGAWTRDRCRPAPSNDVTSSVSCSASSARARVTSPECGRRERTTSLRVLFDLYEIRLRLRARFGSLLERRHRSAPPAPGRPFSGLRRTVRTAPTS